MHCAVTSGFIYYINKTVGTPKILLFIPNNFSFSAIEIPTVITAVDVPVIWDAILGDKFCQYY